ncbi:hypothetical protein [Nonomuraea typhae]|uniref:hypothetical protein n=1 Tax=Nonomuraea typhae TaxID=2603600 RepID=UPI0012FC770E|nr:hypothetical protein [Nonomuraea typhae]
MTSHPPYQPATPAERVGPQAKRTLLTDARHQLARLDQQIRDLDQSIADLQADRAEVADARSLAAETVAHYQKKISDAPEWTGPQTGAINLPPATANADEILGLPRASKARQLVNPQTPEAGS